MDEDREICLAARHPTIHNSVEIFAAVTGRSPKDLEEHGMAPSEYMKQMLMSAQERLDYLAKPGRGVSMRALRGAAESRHFKVTPCIVLFQRFAPGDVYTTTLTIRNVSKVSRRLRISRDPDPFFAVEYHGLNYSNVVAPGLIHAYNVSFSPAESRDYEYRVEFVVDGDGDRDDDDDDVLAVPVIAIGPRSVLDIPDQIEIPTTAVKISSSRTIVVRNVGDAPATFNFYSDQGVLGEEETMQFTASFLSEKSGDFKANLFLSYESELDLRQVSEDTFFLLDTKCLATAIEDKCRKLQSADYRSSAGEKLCLSLQSSSANCTIRIDRSSVRMEDTYLGLSRSKVLTIHNRSDHTVKFQWMCFKDKSSDVERKDEYGRLFQLVRDTEVARRVDLVHYNVCLPDTHELICQRIYVDEIASLMNEDFRYNHASFLLTPEQGEIWPHSCADVTVIFRATKVGEISSVAYLEVTGREDRISLSLHGVGKGPLLRLNVITMDLKNIYLCSVHNYEIVAANKGHINGTLIHKARPTDFGGTVTVSPLCLILEPNEYKSFNLSFSSNRKGDFMERVDFVVEESSEVLSLHIKGCVVCPTLHFDKSSLDFGVVGLGFSKRQEVHLRNLSLVAVSFGATIMDDGDQAPLTHEEFARSDARASFPANPREFVVIPHKGVVQAYSSLKLKVMYTANVVRSGQSTVRVDMWDSESDPVLLPISFCGAIPTLSITPAEIPIRFSFLNFPYLRSINVENNSDLDGYFYIVPQAVGRAEPISQNS
ncbi:hydrocephalus-inducing protein [Harpegnathos saltator]|uniref:hydrocephalus-inducing protein n=1 Tax=Harpegnathos saltator TaxID=610380 RepID=UPI000DBEDC9A|nr:hydrocephalus-inducing protein [Harpegnathos saltator]